MYNRHSGQQLQSGELRRPISYFGLYQILRQIFGPERAGDDFNIGTNLELYEQFADMNINQCIKNQRLRKYICVDNQIVCIAKIDKALTVVCLFLSNTMFTYNVWVLHPPRQ